MDYVPLIRISKLMFLECFKKNHFRWTNVSKLPWHHSNILNNQASILSNFYGYYKISQGIAFILARFVREGYYVT
jgi:hypothetical protein